MKKIIILFTSIFILSIPVFSESGSGQTADDEPGFGLQSDIFKYVLTSSNTMLSTTTGIPTNFEELNDYPLTPGDIFTLLINYGSNTDRSADYITTYDIQLQPDFTMVFPFLGKIDVDSMKISELREMISAQISKMIPVQYISFSLSRPANFSVFIYGGVNISGYINATPVTTVIDAIAACQGFKANASYRDVRIIRGDRTISVDISNFYKNADFESNPRLKSGDKLYIPMAEKVVTITGSVKYPGVYELLPGESLETLLNLSGGLGPDANRDRIEIARINPEGKKKRSIVAETESNTFNPENGDAVYVASVSDNTQSITVEGAVYGKVIQGKAAFTAPTSPVKLEIPYYPGITILDVLDQVGGLTPYAMTGEAELRHAKSDESEPIEVENLWESRNKEYNKDLMPGDHILIPVEKTFVAVFGEVNSAASAIPHVNGYTVMEYIAIAGGINYQTADLNNIEIIDSSGSRSKVSLTDEVPPGAVIYVNKNLLQSSNDVFSDIFIVTGWATVIITLVNLVFDLVGNIDKYFPAN